LTETAIASVERVAQETAREAQDAEFDELSQRNLWSEALQLLLGHDCGANSVALGVRV